MPAAAAGQPVPYVGPIDVAFAIDDTNSMVDAIASLKASLPAILDHIQGASDPGTGTPDYRLALVSFKDDLTIRVNFATNNRDEFLLYALQLAAAAGGNPPEASDEALNTIVHALPQRTHQNIDFAPPFRAAALKIVVLLTDSPPGGFTDQAISPDYIINAHQRALEALAAGVKIDAVFTPRSEAEQQLAENVMKDYGNTTGGGYAMPQPADAGAAILDYFTTYPPSNRPPIALCAPITDTTSCPADANIDGGSWDPDGTIVSSEQAPPSPYDQRTTNVTLTVTDNVGGTASCQAVVTATMCVQGPTIQAPTLLTVEATGPSGGPATFDVTAADSQGNAVPVSCTPDSGAMFPLGQSTVSCSATDAQGTTTTETFTVAVVDTTAPTFSGLADVTIPATSMAGAPYSFSVTATDVVDAAVAATCTPASGSTFAVGISEVHCTATDAHGNAATGGFKVTVTPLADTTPPVVIVSAPPPTEATGSAGAHVTFSASATDNLDPSVAVTCSPPSGSLFPLGSTPVTCSATDAHGNIGSASATVSVVDTTPPSVTVPGGQALDATTTGGTTHTFTASAADIVDGGIVPACIPASGSTFPIGATIVTCSATDAHANVGHAQFTVTVTLVDTTAPVVTVSAPPPAEATGPTGAAVTYTATATDNLDGSVAVACTHPSGSIFPLGSTPVTCSATDSHGNTGIAPLTVVVVDTTAPAVTVPSNSTVPAASGSGAVYTFTATAADLVDGAIPPACAPTSGSTFPIGATTVTCSATDAHANVGHAQFTVTVTLVDMTAPVVTVSAPPPTEATGPTGAAVTYTATATDNLDGSVAVTCTHPSGSIFPLGSTPVTCSATDSHGNTGTEPLTVVVVDTTAPAVTVPSNSTVPAASGSGAVYTFTATAADLVDGAIAPLCSPASGSTFPIGATIVTCSATDAHANVGRSSFTVTVTTVSVTPPSVACEPGENPGGRKAADEAGFYRIDAVAASDGAAITLSFGAYTLANHERIKITWVPARSAVRLVNLADGMRHFQAPFGTDVVLIDAAGRRARVECRAGDDDRGTGADPGGDRRDDRDR